jgi:hypothetical protein
LLASALLDDGRPWWSISASFVGGAAKERAARRPSVRLGSALAALTIAIAAVPLALFGSLTTAGASSTTVTIIISKPGNATRQLEKAFASHHFDIALVARRVTSDRVGSILSVYQTSGSRDTGAAIKVIEDRCNRGASKCIDGLILPLHYSGSAVVTVGVPMPPTPTPTRSK